MPKILMNTVCIGCSVKSATAILRVTGLKRYPDLSDKINRSKVYITLLLLILFFSMCYSYYFTIIHIPITTRGR